MIGYICRKKKFKNIGFCLFYSTANPSGYIQLTFKTMLEAFKELKPYSYIRLQQYVEAGSAIKHTEYEVLKFNIISSPLQTPPFELHNITSVQLTTINKYRSFALRAKYYADLFRTKHVIKVEIIRTLDVLNYVSIESPSIINAGMETGGADMFKINYFGKILYLSQSPQMYKQIMVNVFDRVYELSTVFRAEKSDSPRHLAEIHALDIELVCTKLEEILNVCTLVIRNILQRLNIPYTEADFSVYTYEQACALINKTDREDFSTAEQLAFANIAPKWYYITHYPARIRPFYTLSKDSISESFDLYYGDLELASGSLRIHDYNTLVTQLAASGCNLDAYSTYLDVFKYGAKPHGGLGLGLDRLTKVISSATCVADTVPFSRSYTNIV